MADVMIKSAEVSQDVDMLDDVMNTLKKKLFSAIRSDTQPTQFILSDDEVDYFVDNLLYQRFDPTFLAGELDYKTKGGRTLSDGLRAMGFADTADFIENNIQNKIYNDIAYRYYGLGKNWELNASDDLKNKIRKSFNSTYYRKDQDMGLSEVSEITPKKSFGFDKFSSTLPKNYMTNDLIILNKFKPR